MLRLGGEMRGYSKGTASIPLFLSSTPPSLSCNTYYGASSLPFLRRTPRQTHFSASVYVQKIWNLNPARPSWTSSVKNAGCRVSRDQVKLHMKADVDDDEACELVNGVEISIGQEGLDSICAHLFKAVKNNNGTGILLLSDVFGFQDTSTRDFAYRVACNGYNVLVPDLFRGNPWSKELPREMFEQWLDRQDPQRIAADIAASTKWMANEFLAAGIPKKLGIIGFCFGGGRVIEVLARDGGDCFGIGVSFYGTRMDLSAAAEVKVPVLFIAGDNDPLCPVNVLKGVENRIAHGLSRLVLFEGRGHGFAHRPESPQEDGDAERAFTVLRKWLHDGLVANN